MSYYSRKDGLFLETSSCNTHHVLLHRSFGKKKKHTLKLDRLLDNFEFVIFLWQSVLSENVL